MSSSSPTLKSPFFWVNTSSFFTFSLQIFYFTFSLIPWPNSQLHINFISFKFKFKVNYFNLQFKVNFKIHTYLWQDSTQNSYRRKFHLKISSFSSPSRNPRERRPSIEKLVGHANHNARFHLKKSSFSSSPSRNPREIRTEPAASLNIWANEIGRNTALTPSKSRREGAHSTHS